MNGLSHKQARRYMQADLDGLLGEAQRLDLQTHLFGCEACRAESEALSTLTSHLQSEFHERWDAHDGPSYNVMTKVRSQTRRITMSNKVSFGLRALAGIIALIVLGLGLNFVISQLRSQSIAGGETSAPDNNMPVSSVDAKDRLLAFTKMEDGNYDIFTIHPDGSGLTNITNNSASDSNPIWSPDGKRIIFESDRAGMTQIFMMNADGSDVTQLTSDNTEHSLLPTEDVQLDIWSPDGSSFLFIQKDPNTNLYSLDINDGSKILLASDTRDIDNASWSPSGEYVGYVVWDEANPGEFVPHPYIVDAAGINPRELSKYLSENEQIFTPYFWASDGRSIIFPANTYEQNHETIYQLDPQENTLRALMTTKPMLMLYEWYDGVALGTDVHKANQPLVWQRPDGTSTELDLTKDSDPADCWISKARSSRGNLVLGNYCKKDDNLTLYWTSMDGNEIQPLPEVGVPEVSGALTSLTLSPDEKFITFNFKDENETNLYIWDLENALENPASQPMQVSIGDLGGQYFTPSWQPVIHHKEVIEVEQPPQTNGRLLAVTMKKDGNVDIYTMHADGSGLTNITNNPAQDDSPVWSPDGKRIAFESDRNGSRQIFLMDADGSNLVQLGENEEERKVDQWIGEPYNLSLNLWSPDGDKLVFYEVAVEEEYGMLYMIDANGENKKSLVKETGRYYSPSWSPDGKHIAFITIENSVARIYATDANGDNLREVTKMVPRNETLAPVKYSWSQDGQSISFIASTWNYLLGGGEGSPNYKWTAYEASLDGETLITNALADSQIGGYWNGTYFLSGSAAVSSSPVFTWIHPDGTNTILNPIENCQKLLDSNTGDYINGFSSYKQSSNGNVIIGAYCPNGDKWLYWVDSEGTSKQLLNSPIHVQSIPSNAMYLWGPADFIWSSDDRYIAFNIISLGKTNMYIVDVTEALTNPSIQPFQITIGNGSLYYTPSWQPTP